MESWRQTQLDQEKAEQTLRAVDDPSSPVALNELRLGLAMLPSEQRESLILVGAGGRMVKSIGTAARRELERELGTKVHLDLSVRVRRGWRADERLLDRLGIE